MLWILLIILGSLLFVFVYLFFTRDNTLFTAKEINYIHSHWYRILDMFNDNANNAIMDADKLLNYCLEKKGLTGTLGEKLKKAEHRFSNIDGVWKAHKLRNTLAHELGDINLTDARFALNHFKKAMNDLGAKL